ncbi:hypothetical protein AAHC35_20025 [Klebsiella quasipneumoniae subsp. similipneumoniae]|uniref:hypothetical protein n=1 Tax=Klebsiella/Raoultella group TaxID=2890311 RepID=UPI001E60C338|nr:hypothetical protein [Klebsiella quasipneumoniae]MCM5726764.1 hypothetical protein [Klebsiella pneumoniae]MCB3003270.1 hypothetical protein [Klebsiella quasipneumoniae]HBY2483765.1 hypothetical protein [Klebsiella pneumoniae]HBY4569980.1 hypothetical protein [Klebsiella pneumoniae]HEN5184254.1 hypothetical protein [Klebsiella pneumoniae]
MTTETVETNQPDEQDGTFDRNYTEVKRLKVLIADDGTKIPFSANMKVVYAYLYTFQTNKDRRNYPEPIHPNMEIIAWENGITKPTAQKAVDDLMRAGVLIKDQIQVGSGFKSNNYVVLKPSKVVARGITPPHPNASKYSTVEESGKNEQKRDVVEPAAPTAGKPDGVPVVDIPVDADLSGSDDPSLSDSTGRNVVELPRNGRPKLSFKFVSPDDDDQEETYQGYGGDIEQETYSEPTQADFDAALENL